MEIDRNILFVLLLNFHISGHEQFLAFRPVTLFFQLCRLIFELDQLQWKCMLCFSYYSLGDGEGYAYLLILI